jgi:3',5'-cyclic AMP phosphodiesterase CpdA
MTHSLHFAHVTDIHISAQGDTWSTLGSAADPLLAQTIDRLNALDDLDFVLITGDVLDQAVEAELERFMALLGRLNKPWHFLPGNHDGFYHPDHPQAFAPHEAVPRIDPRMASPRPDAQRARWSRPVAEGVQLIGLDSRMPDDWGGHVDAAQMAWLQDELEAHRDSLVIAAVHHPLHHLTELSRQPLWSRFVCSNGAQIEALLDQHPNVKLVLSGHHHAQQIRVRGTGSHARSSRLHISTGALAGYPCVYRTVRVREQEDGWRTQVETHSPADDGVRKLSFDLLEEANVARHFNPHDLTAWAAFVAGEPHDQTFDGVL